MCCILDVNSFEQSFSGTSDCGFYTFGQMCRFVRRLASRCLISSSVPVEDDWLGLSSINLASATQLSSQQFLHRLRLEAKVATASKRKAESDLSESKGGKDAVDSLSTKLQEQFAIAARGYVCFLLDSVLKHDGLTAELTRGLGCFDPVVVFSMPLDLGLSLFQILFRSFSSRRWVKARDVDKYLDEYSGFIEDVRKDCPGLVADPKMAFNLVELYMTFPSLRNRSHLLHVFRLSCLCLTSVSPDLPDVVYGSVDSSKGTCPLSEAFFPTQSYLSVVSGSSAICSSPSAIASFLTFEEQFGDAGFPDSFDPWTSVDFFGRWELFQKFQSVYNGISGGPREVPPRGGKTSSISSGSKSGSVAKEPGPSGGLVSCAAVAVAADLKECGSKTN